MSDRPSFDLAALTERMRSLQGSLAGMNDAIGSGEATGHAGGGLVTAKVNGEGRVTSLRMDPSVIDPDDPQSLEEMVVTAVAAAQAALRDMRAKQVGEFTEGMLSLADGLRTENQHYRDSPLTDPLLSRAATSPSAPEGGPAAR